MKTQKISIATLFVCMFFASGNLMAGEAEMETFKRFDKNRDGIVDPNEFIETHNALINLNKTNGLLQADSPVSFFMYDVDRDNKITLEEFDQGEAMRLAQEKSDLAKSNTMKKNTTNKGGNGKGQGSNMGMGRNMPTFSEFDTDNDGKLTQTEFQAAQQARMTERAEQGFPMRNIANASRFEDIDANGDGVVNEDEFQRHQIEKRKNY